MPEQNEKDLVGLVEEKYEEVQRHQLPFNIRRLDNFSLYAGKQFATWNPILQKMVIKDERKNVVGTASPRRSINLMVGMVLTYLSKINRPPQFKFFPATREHEDVYSAAVADIVVPFYLKTLGISGQLGLYNDLSAIIFADAFLKIFWNPNAGDWVTVNGKRYRAGAMEACTRSPLACGIDPMASSIAEADYMMEFSVRSLDWLRRHYPGFDFKEEPTHEVGTYQMRLRAYYDNRTSATWGTGQKTAMLKEYYEAPTKDHPDGRIITTCNGRLLDYKDPNPYGCFPYVRFGAIPMPERFESMSPIQNTKAAQQGYNMMFSLLEDWYRRARPKIFAETGTLRGKMTNTPFEVIEYDPTERPPTYSPPPPLPSDVFAMKNQYRQAFDETSGIGQLTQGGQASNIRSAEQLIAGVEQDHQKFGPLITMRNESMEGVARLILKNAQKFVVVKQIARIIGSHATHKITAFTRADLRGNVDVQIVPGSTLPQSVTARMAVAKDFFTSGVYGIPGTRDARLRLMSHIGDASMLIPPFEDDNMASESAREENGRMNLGEIIEPPADYEPHDVHLYQHNLERNMPDFKKRPERVQQSFQIHCKWHEKMMQAQAQAQAMGAIPQPVPRPIQEIATLPGAARPVVAGTPLPQPQGQQPMPGGAMQM